MSNTEKSFSDKWRKNPNLAFFETSNENSEIYKWILSRNGFGNGESLKKYLSRHRSILDAGCGNGRVTALIKNNCEANTKITAIDLTADVAYKNLSVMDNVEVISQDLLGDLSSLGYFDFIYCQEVLHHTKNPQAAFLNLTKQLADSGEIAIYVYKKKAPVREYVDDYIRDRISSMSYEEAMKHCDQITALGEALTKQKVSVKVPEVSLLEIPEGEYDLQRFIYHFFMKCFWNDEFSIHDNSVINYDWYHPQECSRHTLDEIRSWFAAADLEICFENVDFYGITVRGIKQ